MRLSATFLALPLLLAAAPERAFADEWLLDFDGRFGLGVGTRFDDPHADVALELGLGLRIGLGTAPRDSWVTALMPEISYDGLYGPRQNQSFVLGLGLGRTDGTFLLGVVPGFVYALNKDSSGSTEITGYGAQVLATAEISKWVGVQALYQLTSYAGQPLVHDVRAMVSLNFIGIAIAWLFTHKGGGIGI